MTRISTRTPWFKELQKWRTGCEGRISVLKRRHRFRRRVVGRTQKQGCPKCGAGGGHPVWILATGYPGKRIHQLTLRADQIVPVRRRIANYRKLQAALERICEYNREQLRQTHPGLPEIRSLFLDQAVSPAVMSGTAELGMG